MDLPWRRRWRRRRRHILSYIKVSRAKTFYFMLFGGLLKYISEL